MPVSCFHVHRMGDTLPVAEINAAIPHGDRITGLIRPLFALSWQCCSKPLLEMNSGRAANFSPRLIAHSSVANDLRASSTFVLQYQL
jgi:hypothetical protein